MRVTWDFKDYELLDCSRGERLERWGPVRLVRPDPQVLWDVPRAEIWKQADAVYHRSASGGGSWEMKRPLPDGGWVLQWRELRFRVRPTGFKHTGLFPEQAVNWAWLTTRIQESARPLSVLNLFAYTGGATLAMAAAGAKVCHVDAAKGMVQWARENAELSGLSSRPVRWIVDDCRKFLEREIRRGNRYDGIVMDPPSYGRGPNGEVWKLEDQLYDLLDTASKVLSDHPSFFLLNSYTGGLSASVMRYLLGVTVEGRFGGETRAEEIGLPVTSTGMALPCGSTAVWTGTDASIGESGLGS